MSPPPPPHVPLEAHPHAGCHVAGHPRLVRGHVPPRDAREGIRGGPREPGAEDGGVRSRESVGDDVAGVVAAGAPLSAASRTGGQGGPGAGRALKASLVVGELAVVNNHEACKESGRSEQEEAAAPPMRRREAPPRAGGRGCIRTCTAARYPAQVESHDPAPGRKLKWGEGRPDRPGELVGSLDHRVPVVLHYLGVG
eukprot:CAMPEP_0182860066 /NCGR_PEP_ID=MMETSP0034_2-20130328/4694_1 /TAXON_ID=156128 /ORGANISM="Nephroselmis pyriformis, Strain CCMP717" /LENGTH=196 /DNA_ID=CAMNT_0024991803 /DNA_START=332 /DNA_END=921 /DNA_ORIENTATION=-